MDLEHVPDTLLGCAIALLVTLFGVVWRMSAQAAKSEAAQRNAKEELIELRTKQARFASDIRELREAAAENKGFRKKLASRNPEEE